MSTEKQTVKLHLAGPAAGKPTLKDVLALFKKLTGREPTPDEVKEAQAAWDE